MADLVFSVVSPVACNSRSPPRLCTPRCGRTAAAPPPPRATPTRQRRHSSSAPAHPSPAPPPPAPASVSVPVLNGGNSYKLPYIVRTPEYHVVEALVVCYYYNLVELSARCPRQQLRCNTAGGAQQFYDGARFLLRISVDKKYTQSCTEWQFFANDMYQYATYQLREV